MMVLEEVHRPYTKKTGGEAFESGLSVRDLTLDGPRSRCNYMYPWAKGERDKYAGKLRDRIVMIGVENETAAFAGVIRLEGQILGVEGPDPSGNGQASTSSSAASKKG